MPHHNWGEEDFDWKALDDALHDLNEFCVKWGRLGLHTKEKWGVARVSTWFFDGTFHSLWKPGHAWNRYPKLWMWKLDNLIGVYVNKLGFVGLVRSYQTLVLAEAYRRVVRKYPHIANEIVHECPIPRLVGSFATWHQLEYWRKNGQPTSLDSDVNYGKIFQVLNRLLARLNRHNWRGIS